MPSQAELADSARAYVRALTAALQARSAQDPGLGPFAQALAACDMARCRTEPRPRLVHPAMAHLSQLRAGIAGSADFAGHARHAAATLDWFPVFEGGGIDPRVADGMLAAQAVGTYGCFAHERLAVGMFLIAPGVHYPLHTHEATEVYFALAGGIELRHGVGGAPFELRAGDHSITPPHRVHAVATGQEPALVAYVWKGDIRCRNWWWAQEADGSWTRTAWHRPAAGPWLPLETEAVDPAIMAEAHGPAA